MSRKISKETIESMMELSLFTCMTLMIHTTFDFKDERLVIDQDQIRRNINNVIAEIEHIYTYAPNKECYRVNIIAKCAKSLKENMFEWLNHLNSGGSIIEPVSFLIQSDLFSFIGLISCAYHELANKKGE